MKKISQSIVLCDFLYTFLHFMDFDKVMTVKMTAFF